VLPPSNPGFTSTLDLVAARSARDGLRSLLGAERSAAAEFLRALADFDARRGWEPLGHASLFAFLTAELGLSKGAAYVRFSAARLLQRFPAVIEPIRDGRLCLSSVGELARVATERNFAEVLPRFFGCSSREAREVAAVIAPREEPSRMMIVTRALPSAALQLVPSTPVAVAALPAPPPAPGLTTQGPVRSVEVRAHELAPVRVPEQRTEIEPLSAGLRRVHMTVSRETLALFDAARDGLSHTAPNASADQVLRAAFEALLEKQAKARGQVTHPRKTVAAAPANAQVSGDPPRHRRAGPRSAIPAAVRRAVWSRDAGRCTWPIDGGGTCGSTHRLEVDHVVPWAKGGDDSAGNLRLVCGRHNAIAARRAFGFDYGERRPR
jgi:hypothetical protein